MQRKLLQGLSAKVSLTSLEVRLGCKPAPSESESPVHT